MLLLGGAVSLLITILYLIAGVPVKSHWLISLYPLNTVVNEKHAQGFFLPQALVQPCCEQLEKCHILLLSWDKTFHFREGCNVLFICKLKFTWSSFGVGRKSTTTKKKTCHKNCKVIVGLGDLRGLFQPQQLCVSVKSLIFSLIFLKVWEQGANENNILKWCSFWFCKISMNFQSWATVLGTLCTYKGNSCPRKIKVGLAWSEPWLRQNMNLKHNN